MHSNNLFDAVEDYRLAKECMEEWYGVKKPSIRLIQKGMNTTFEIGVSEKRFALRISPSNWLSPEEICSEVDLISYLCSFENILTCVPVSNLLHQSATILQDSLGKKRVCILFEWIEEDFLHSSIDDVVLHKIGKCIALLHNALRSMEVGSSFKRPVWDMNNTFCYDSPFSIKHTKLWLDDHKIRICYQAHSIMYEGLSSWKHTSNDVGLIHGDAFYRNLFMRGDRIGFVDFDMCCWGYYLYDIYNFFWPSNQSNISNAQERIFEGYSEIRDIPDNYHELHKVFGILHLLRALCWLCGQAPFQNQEEAVKGSFDMLNAFLFTM